MNNAQQTKKSCIVFSKDSTWQAKIQFCECRFALISKDIANLQTITRKQATNQQMIKINIQTLDGELDIEIKKNENRFIVLVILSKSAFFKESGKVWNGNTLENGKVLEIVGLIKESFQNPSLLRSLTINDGILVKIILNDKDIDTKLIFTDFENGTIEGELMKKLFFFR